MPKQNAPENDQLSEAETIRRREAAIKTMLATPPKPFTPTAKSKASRPKAASRKASKKA